MDKKIKTHWLVIFLSIMLVSCGTPVATSYPSQPQSNFAIRFEYGSCDTNVLDTFNDRYTRDMIVEPDVTITLHLSDSQMAAIYQKMVGARFFDYPEVFSIPTPKNGTVGIVTPVTQYRIAVRNGDLTKSLFWLDEIFDPTTPEADKLRELFQLIIKIIEEQPDYKKLPERKAGCA